MLTQTTEQLEPGRITRHTVHENGTRLSYSEVMDRWITDSQFCQAFIELLNASPYEAYRWETPPVTKETIERPFEYAMISSPGFAKRKTDSKTYQEYFTDSDSHSGIVTFSNLRGDATLVVPSPRTSKDVYGHLAAFMRGAPEDQRETLWKVIGQTMRSNLSDQPCWLSTAGGGVAWLHVRIDSIPKYYCCPEFKRFSVS